MQERITDAGLKGVAALARLKRLRLSECEQITGKGIAHLAGLKNLEELGLSHTHLDDTAFEPLSKLKSLRKLLIDSTKISRGGYEKLKAALPECRIYYE